MPTAGRALVARRFDSKVGPVLRRARCRLRDQRELAAPIGPASKPALTRPPVQMRRGWVLALPKDAKACAAFDLQRAAAARSARGGPARPRMRLLAVITER